MSEMTSFPFLPNGRVDIESDEESCKKVLTGMSEVSSLPFLPDGGAFFERRREWSLTIK